MEKVFCVARKDLEKLTGSPLPEGGFSSPSLMDVLELPQYFLSRPSAEKDPRYKQIIPYQLFAVEEKLFVYQRGSAVGEQRLSGKYSAGIGGHINIDDASRKTLSLEDFYYALERERLEELICSSGIETRFIGWINDDSDDVGRVHLGAVHCCFLKAREEISIRPDGEDIGHIGWFEPSNILQKGEFFEKWSMLAASLFRDIRFAAH